MWRRASLLILLLIWVAACREGPAEPTRAQPARPPTPTLRPAATDPVARAPEVVGPTAVMTAPQVDQAPLSPSLSVGPGVPAHVAAAGQRLLSDRFAGAGPGQLSLTMHQGRPLSRWLLAPAAPFATVRDGLTLGELQAAWRGENRTLGRLVIEADVAAALALQWGAAEASTTQLVMPGQLMEALWAARPSWTLVPFERLRPEYKVLRLDEVSPLDGDFMPGSYPLTLSIGLSGEADLVEAFRASWPGPHSNYDPGLLTRVAMSGVTGLTRATAYQMEIRGLTAPAAVVGPVLAGADVAHISHEVPFAPDCPPPNPLGTTVFCARDDYLALLNAVGADVIELTGNHVNDWGPDSLVHSLALYESAGMKTFGGGRNLAEAEQALTLSDHGNQIAFVGCNPQGPPGAWATSQRAGSRPCDEAAFRAQIAELDEQGYVVIATLQYAEFYHYAPTPQQRADFRALAAAGAAAVSGSQGHHAQGFDFWQGSFIHYGLGNLFFDQMQMLGTRQSFIDLYTIYDGRLISVELFTGLIENYCCPRAMTAVERDQLLQAVFAASGW